MKSTRQQLVLLLFFVLVIISCDKDYNTIGEGLVNEVHFNQVVDSISIIKSEQLFFGANSVTSNPVQTNNLPYNLLGYYNHPVYGGTTANVVTQVALSEYGKDFGSDPIIKKVVLSIPYFNRVISTDNETGSSVYELDSIYGNSPINLKMFRSNYFLNDFDINGETRKYYSNEDNVSLPGIDNELLYENESFLPSNQEVTGEIIEVDGVLEAERFSPRLRVELDTVDFEWILENANLTNISSSSNFTDFYRGLFFKVEASGLDGVLLGLDFSNAEIQIFYGDISSDIETVSSEESIKILLSGKKVNMLKNSDFIEPNDLNESIYLNGGQGAMATIKLFNGLDNDNNGISDKLDDLRAKDVLVNEANIEFYVNQNLLLGNDAEPDRLFLYDMENNNVLLDYQFDDSQNIESSTAKQDHLGKLIKDDSDFGIKYKINITEHVTDLIRNDSINVKLGLVVTNNVLNLGLSELKDEVDINGSEIESIFSASVLSHRGTVLFNENALDNEKKLKLKIYYTEENN
jgi:hypothetical protein